MTITVESKPSAMLANHAFELAVSPMVVVSRQGQICLWNKAAEKLLDPEKFGRLQIDAPVEQLFESRSNALLTDIIVSAGGSALTVSLCSNNLKSAKATKRSVKVSALTNTDRGICYLLTIGTDLQMLNSFRQMTSQLRESNQQAATHLKRLQDVELKNQELEHFSISTAHDLKAPLIQVTMLLDLFVSEYGEGIKEEAMQVIGKACSSANNLRVMIDELLNNARKIDKEASNQCIDLNQSVAKVIKGMDTILNNIDAQISVPSDMGIFHGNDIKFQQVLNNILSNAIKYRSAGRKLIISIEVETSENKADLMRIMDNGIGFDSAETNQLFQPFERLENSDTEGHGIGLSTCQRICEQQGWMLEASGTPGVGSQFLIAFNNHVLPEKNAA